MPLRFASALSILLRFVTAKLMRAYRKKSLEKVDIAIQKAVLRGCFFCFQMIVKSKK